MITVHDDSDHNAILIEPLEELSKDDFDELTKRFNAYVNQHDSIPNLVIHAKSFPGWDSFGALAHHLEFVENHHKLIKKIAIVSDSASLSVFPGLVDHFVSAKVRRFPENQLGDAMQWVSSTEEENGGFTIMSAVSDDVVAVEAKGKISSKDYDEVLVPLLENKLKEHK